MGHKRGAKPKDERRTEQLFLRISVKLRRRLEELAELRRDVLGIPLENLSPMSVGILERAVEREVEEVHQLRAARQRVAESALQAVAAGA